MLHVSCKIKGVRALNVHINMHSSRFKLRVCMYVSVCLCVYLGSYSVRVCMCVHACM